MHKNICPICFSYMINDRNHLEYLKCSCGFAIKEKMEKKSMGKISLQELNKHNYPTTPEIDANLNDLLAKMNQVRQSYNKPMIVTSGLRSDEQQKKLIADGKSKASKSKHLLGQAVDIQDSDGALAAWVKKNLTLMEQFGLYMEDFDHTKGWVHFQSVGPKSGKRVFIP